MIRTLDPGNRVLLGVILCGALGCTTVSEDKADVLSLGMPFSEAQRVLARHSHATTSLAPWHDPGKGWSMYNYEIPNRRIVTLFVLHESEDVIGGIGVVTIVGSTNFVNRTEVHKIKLWDREHGGGTLRREAR
jgi:hypothetical protein